VRELEATLQQFGEFLLKGRLVKERAAAYCVRWVRRFLMRPAARDPLGDQVRSFCEDLEREGCQDWQVRQAEQALRIYWLNFRRTADWVRRPASALESGRVEPLAALDELRRRIRTRHYSYRTEVAYVDWARRFLTYLAETQTTPNPEVTPDAARDYLTHLAVHQHVSASTQNQALAVILLLCRDVLGVQIEGLANAVKAKRGTRLPVVLSVPEVALLLGAMRGTTWLMAALIYGGGLRVTEAHGQPGSPRPHPDRGELHSEGSRLPAIPRSMPLPAGLSPDPPQTGASPWASCDCDSASAPLYLRRGTPWFSPAGREGGGRD
jgi:hypothetical protein